MNMVAFDGLVQEMGNVSTRRGIFRLLGGVAAVGAGLAVTAGDDSLAKSRGNGNSKSRGKASREQGNSHSQDAVSAQGKGKGKKVTICFQNQTRTAKKKSVQSKFPGATMGACPQTPAPPDKTNPQPQPQPQPQPMACTNFILSGGPNQTDPIGIDDDGAIYHVTAGKYLLIDNNGMASQHPPIVFTGNVGDVLQLYGRDWGGCRSFSPLWAHCLATGQKKQIYTGFSGVGCSNPKGEFLLQNITLEL